MSRFGELVKKLRKEKGLTLETVAQRLGSHKGYVSGIENDKVNQTSVKIIMKYAKTFEKDARKLARLAWVDKAHALLRGDAEEVLKWYFPRESVLDHPHSRKDEPQRTSQLDSGCTSPKI